jgi:hypothetical protein
MSTGSKPFGFPFEPYSIQKDFMEALYIVLEEGKVGIFESPTGTVRPKIHESQPNYRSALHRLTLFIKFY